MAARHADFFKAIRNRSYFKLRRMLLVNPGLVAARDRGLFGLDLLTQTSGWNWKTRLIAKLLMRSMDYSSISTVAHNINECRREGRSTPEHEVVFQLLEEEVTRMASYYPE